MVSPTTPTPSPHSPPPRPHKKACCSPPTNSLPHPDRSAKAIPQKTTLFCSYLLFYHHRLDHPLRRIQPSRKLRLHFVEPHPMRDIYSRIDQLLPHRLHHAIEILPGCIPAAHQRSLPLVELRMTELD